jgi:hypothetical protein
MIRREEEKRVQKGMPFGISEKSSEQDPFDALNIERLATESPSEAEMTSRLAWAIRRTADDLQHDPRKRYSYEEWCEFTRLIKFSQVGMSGLEYDEETDGVVEWDWLEESSPMLSGQTESEWILDRLCESLLRLLKRGKLGLDEAPDSAFPSSSSTDSPSFDLPRRRTQVGSVSVDSAQNLPKDKERQRRALGVDGLLTFFTGDRRDGRAYASDAPIWSSKAKDRAKERRKSNGGKNQRGPFRKLQHSMATGALGGGRGGAGIRTLKMRHFTGDRPRIADD